MKLGNWQRLPWLLAGLAHLNEDTARRCANESIAQYDSAPDEAALHHRLTLKFCSKVGPLRADLEAFAAGASRDELPAFRTEATKLFFIPVTERSIEEPHSRVMRAITYRHHSPLSVTMSLRMRVIEWTIARSAERMFAFSECLKRVQSIRRIPYMLELGLHPWLRELLTSGKPNQTSTWCTLLTSIIYRCDDVTQFHDFSQAKKRHESGKRQLAKDAKPFLDKANKALTFDLVLARAAHEQLQLVHEADHVFSLPPSEDASAFQPMLQEMVRPLTSPVPSAAAALEDAFGMVLDVEDEEQAHAIVAVEAREEERQFFRIVKLKPGDQHTQELAPAAGRKLLNHQMVVETIGQVRGRSLIFCL